MNMSAEESKFQLWWNSPSVRQTVGIVYSLGASVVIIGAMFKILHLQGASYVLGTGMTVEAMLFAMGALDKPHKEYEWDKVYPQFNDEYNSDLIVSSEGIGVHESVGGGGRMPSKSIGMSHVETISDDDVKKLSEGIKNLTTTAQQFAGLSNVVGATDQFVKNIEGASEVTGKFIRTQESLNGVTGLLSTSYQGITEGMEMVEKNTKLYAGRVDEINKNLSSINSIYEIQLKNIHAQSEGLTQQTESVRAVSNELNLIAGDVQKMKTATLIAAEETENFKAGTVKLSKQVTDLNQVYGNMLNALS